MRLMLKVLSRLRLDTSRDEFVKETSVEHARVTLEVTLTTPEVKYWEWRTVPGQYGEMTKARVKWLEYSTEKVELITKFLRLMTTFKAHVQRVIAQYRAIHSSKDALPP
ncbi:hypothetical protein LSAT2_000462, partial [Lamellibrachia satsuma]